MTYNTRLAQEVGLWAAEQGRGEPFHLAAFKAYFAEGLNLASKGVLLGVVESAGLPSEEAGEVMEKRLFSGAVDRDWALARELNITAVPTFILGGKRLVGAQPYEELVRFVRSA